MLTTELDLQNLLNASGTLPQDVPITMLNLVRYNDQAKYQSPGAHSPCSGSEAYVQRYAPAFNQVAAAAGITGIRVSYLGAVLARLVGPVDEHWHNVVLVEYPNFAAFRAVIEHPRYASEADPHRRAALAAWRLFATTKATLG